MLDGSLSYLKGCRIVAVLRFDADLEWDSDLLPFVGVASESEALPIGDERKFWSAAALDGLQPQISEAEGYGHTNDQLLDLVVDRRPARASTSPRAVEFAGNKLATPGKDGVRPGDGCDLGENRTPEPMTDLAERGSVRVRQLQRAFRMRFSAARYSLRARSSWSTVPVT